MLQEAPTQEEQLEYGRSLRALKTSWTPELRKAYFEWIRKAYNYRGGNSFRGFIKIIRNDAIATLSDGDKTALGALLDEPPVQTAVVAAAPPRPFVKAWTLDELVPIVDKGLKGRNFDRGRLLFGAAQCASCHRYNNEGGSFGPDLTGASGRFSARDLLESIVLPSKTISDQYEAVTIATVDGEVVTGRIVNLNGDNLTINVNMLDPNGLVNVNRTKVEEMKPSPVSMMPEGLFNTLSQDEILDLTAYLLSRGDRKSEMFRPEGRAAQAGSVEAESQAAK